eukprot:5231562-Pleurochrysis_carterae.AAC.2
MMSGINQMKAWAASMKIGERGRPRSAGCSSMYSARASRAAERMAVVRRTINLRPRVRARVLAPHREDQKDVHGCAR